MSTGFDEARHVAVGEWSRRSASVIVPMALSLVPARSVVDVGCGLGVWLAAFREHGVADVLGIDGDHVSPDLLEIPRDAFEAHDLRLPLELARTFELVVSLEVAEHLPEESADVFVDSLVRLGPVILFSAAIPHQGGHHHVNEQWPAYWAARFHDRGYVHVDCLRRRLWTNPDVAPWFAQNCLFYVRRDALADYPELERQRDPDEPYPLALVHPARFLEWVEWTLSRLG